jgi:predicted dehydrogenase
MEIGVVGCGYWGSKHLRVLQSLPGVDHVVAIDGSPDRLGAVAESFPTAGRADRLEDALDGLDALVVATPPLSHVPLATQGIEAGCAVLVEKPLAPSAAEARYLEGLARAADVPLMVGHTFEHNAAVWALRDLLRAGELGPVYYADAARLNLGLYQTDVNVIWDLAPHDVSIFNFVLDSQPTWVEAWGSRHVHPLLEDVAYLRLYYEDKRVTATIHVSWLDPCKVRRLTLVGSRQMAVYNDLATEPVRIFDKGVEMPPPDDGSGSIPMSYRYGDIRSPYVAAQEPLTVQDKRFVDIAQHRRSDETNVANGVAVVEVLDAADRALREQRRVTIAEVREALPLALASGEAG